MEIEIQYKLNTHDKINIDLVKESDFHILFIIFAEDILMVVSLDNVVDEDRPNQMTRQFTLYHGE